MFLIAKYLITAAIIVLVSEVAKRSDHIGALIASLPLVTVMALIWLHVENQTTEKISNHAFYTFWYVIPTLPMFLVFPYVNQHYGFWPALLMGVVITLVSFVLWSFIAKQFGVNLF